MKKLGFELALWAALMIAFPASAQTTPSDPLASLSTEELALLPQYAGAVVSIVSDPQAAADALKALLALTPRPTPFRGMVQVARADALRQMPGNRPEAFSAVAEAVLLLPDQAFPKFLASEIYIFGGNPAEAADLWLAATRIDPAMARQQHEYFIMALLGRLDDMGDLRRADLVRAQLLEIGYPASQTIRSGYAMSVIDSRITKGDVAGAAQLIPSVLTPEDFGELLSDKKFRELWPNIESWAGVRLEKQWQVYLDTVRRRWEGSRSMDAGREYALALTQTDDPATIVSEFEPAFADDHDVNTQLDAQFLATPLAKALIAVGRSDDAFKLYERLAGLWPYDTDVRGLNISGNWAQQELQAGKVHSALERIDGVIRNATARGPEVNISALMAMHVVRACALHALDREGDSAASVAKISLQKENSPESYMALLSCKRDRAAAKAFLLSRLADPKRYGFALKLVQPREDHPWSPYIAADRAFFDDLANDKDIVEAARRIGRKLAFPVLGPRPAS